MFGVRSPNDLPEGWTVREPVPEDAEAIARLTNEATIAETGVPFATAADVRDELTRPDRGPLSGTLVFDGDGSPIGYTQVREASDEVVHLFVFTHPSVWGRGLSTWLIRRDEARVAERWPGGVPVRLSSYGGNEAAVRLFAALGYERVRTFWSMEISLEEPPPPPVIDEGISIRTFEREQDEHAVHAAFAEAFEDHWGSAYSSFERWVHQEIEGEGSRFDPTLWFVALEGAEVVGAATCSSGWASDEGAAQVGMLGVRRPWRRRGIALALLHTAFGEFHRRGIPRAQLGVDSANPTGATRLYERAGMHPIRSWEIWEKRVAAADGERDPAGT